MSLKKITTQFTRYGGVAAGSAGADWCIFAVLELLGSNYLLAQIIARFGGGAFSFFVNKNWSFDQTGGHLLVQGRRFLILYAFSFSLSLGLIYAFVEILFLNPYFAKIFSDIICFILNFLTMRSYVFNGRSGFTTYIRGGWESLSKRTK